MFALTFLLWLFSCCFCLSVEGRLLGTLVSQIVFTRNILIATKFHKCKYNTTRRDASQNETETTESAVIRGT